MMTVTPRLPVQLLHHAAECGPVPAGPARQWARPESRYLRFHGQHARNGHAAHLSAGQLEGGALGIPGRSPGVPIPWPGARGGRSPRRTAPGSWGRRRCPWQRFPQTADIQGTGTPAPPFGECGGGSTPFWRTCPRPSTSTWPEVGVSRPFKCCTSVDLPRAGVADHANEFTILRWSGSRPSMAVA